jgi:Xaa-Pro aminopeptidase
MSRNNLLMFAASEHDADMRYATGLLVPDPFIYLWTRKGQPIVVMNDLEYDRARKHLRRSRILSQSTFVRKLRESGYEHPRPAQIIRLLLEEQGIKKVHVPAGFPFGLAEDLRKLNIKVRLNKGPVFPERTVKCADEIKKISAALTMAEVGLAEAVQVLRTARVGGGKRLFHRDVPLTAEKLRSVIHVAVMQAGGSACHTIVAPGQQACDPHEIGHGPLRAHEPIVIDIFPRSQKTGYYGDITRTVVKGRATEGVRALYQTVAQAQKLAFAKLRPGAVTGKIHEAVQDFFLHQGYRTGRHQGRMQGFFHGTGHGLGLDLHEAPRLSPFSESRLTPGQVVTVEPGLYYPGIGAVRLEDVALITPGRPRNLTKFEKVLEL